MQLLGKLFVRAGIPVGLAVLPGLALADSLIDYESIATAVTTELGLAFTAMAAVVGLLMAARVGWRFFKTMVR